MSTKPQDSSDVYRRLVESVSDYAIFALDAKGFVSSWNPGAQHVKGYTDAFNLNVTGCLVKPVTFAESSDLMVTLKKYRTLVEMP